MNLLEVVIILCITGGVVVINYLVFACSKISPCYIEFDDRRKSEMKLMREYNEGFTKIFMMYIATTFVIALFTLASFSAFVAYVLMGIQLLYTVVASLVMLWMYVRSRLYWEREFREEEGKKISEICDFELAV